MAQDDLAQLLRTLHEPGRPLILCNIYDAATAHIIGKHPASKAIATASYAVAAVQGIEDDGMTLEQNLKALRTFLPIAATYGKPITVDLQDGYQDDLNLAIESVIDLGAVGCNLEDFNRGSGKLYSIEEATERVRRAIGVAAEKGVKNFALNARTDVLKHEGSIDEVVERGNAFLAAGAANIFVLGGSKRGGLFRADIIQLVEAFNGKLNVLLNLGPGSLTIQELKEIGVARISVGPGLYRRAMDNFSESANSLLTA